MCPRSAVYVPNARLSSTELQSAVLDGELVALGEGFVPIDAPHTAHVRAASLSPLVIDARVIISDRSAAWVWGWATMPRAVTTCVSIVARIPSPDRRRLRAREVVIHDGEWVMLGEVAVTSPVRTLIDLARHDSGVDLAALLERGIRTHRVELPQLEAALTSRTNLSFVRMARRRLEEASRAAAALDRTINAISPAQPLLTRYTS
jgi:hypothetical protein